ncbi:MULTISPECIES: NUDIX hydrolase [Frankia]|uniref:NUDIX hydrolase n=2 Tax=Frankiaceae TaxID=74712 RepID=UPI0009E5CE1B|nr:MULTISPECIES: NUDIX hydrolase [Frankia]
MSDRWTVHREDVIYASPWVSIHLADVEAPSGARIPHHLVRVPASGAGTIMVNTDGHILLLFRYRFIVSRFGWEIPAGKVEKGEEPAETARREALEETGWEPQDLQHLLSMNTSPGLTDQVSHLFLARKSDQRGSPVDTDESVCLRWCTSAEIRALIQAGEITDAFTLSGLLWYLTLMS